MDDLKKLPQRDKTLIDVLNRLYEQNWQRDSQLDEIIKNINELSASIRTSGLRQHERLDVTDEAIEKSHKALLHYQNNMLSLVREQDRIGGTMGELEKRLAAIVFAQENISQEQTDLHNRFEAHEKTSREHHAYSMLQEEVFSQKIADANQNISEHYMDLEKRFDETMRETRQQLDDFRLEIMRRLLALDGIEAALRELLIRTEVIEKKPFWFLRIFRSFYRLLRTKIRALLGIEKKITMQDNENADESNTHP